MSIDFLKIVEIFNKNLTLFIYGIQTTLTFAIVGTILGFLIGLMVGGVRAVEIGENDSFVVRLIKSLGKLVSGFYIWVFRGTPMMVQAMFIYYFLNLERG